MLEIKIIRTYTDRSVTNGLLLVNGKQIGHTMEKPETNGVWGQCIGNGHYVGKIICTEYSPFTIKLKHCGQRSDACIIPRGDYEAICEGICIGRRNPNDKYSLHDCEKVFDILSKTIQRHICNGDRKMSVTIMDDAFKERKKNWRKIVDETEEDDFFNEDEWN